jgi:hypothetical protein
VIRREEARMARQGIRSVSRRQFLGRSAAVSLLGWSVPGACAADGKPVLEAGQGVVDITPPLGIEMGGFHRAPGNERRIRGIRKPTAARALVLRYRDDQAAIVSLDVIGVSRGFSDRTRQAVARATGVPAANVRLCATHSHSTPTFLPLRQWGAVSPEYEAAVEKKVVEAVRKAHADLAPAELSVGTDRAVGGNFNRTASTWKTDKDFTKDSSDADRWLDTTLHALRFDRGAGRPALLWYHFSAHPVCYTDDQAGPDWPALVDEQALGELKLLPSFLQGHCGDVNPGDGKPWIGDAQKTSRAVYAALKGAVGNARRVKVDGLRTIGQEFTAPLDLARFKDSLERYRREPARATGGEWVDAGFAKDWAGWAATWDLKKAGHAAPLSALRLGEVGLLFHPAELYSYYGLAIRRDSPFAHTLAVGYTDDLIGYLTDPKAYTAGEYAAVVVPKILSLPPFTPDAARTMTEAAVGLLKKVAS